MRLDLYLVDTKIVQSRNRAQMLIQSGDVFVDGKQATKASQKVGSDSEIAVNDSIKYVSRAGLKLEYALEVFGVDPYKLHCLDIGSSTGGFTDLLLQKGAAKVTAVDVGTMQMDEGISADPRVTLFEQTDIRDFFPRDKFDLIVTDVSFISQRKIADTVSRIASSSTKFITLIKPQFEVGEAFVGRGGIVKDAARPQKAVAAVVESFESVGFELQDRVYPSVIKGGDGNVEYLAYFTNGV
jgi:23S rRNA (cytidine1920-2'-O)/16S rRNA (cytidine1409-2'-O)-methyltransferase